MKSVHRASDEGFEHRCDFSIGRPDGFGGVGGHEAVAFGREFLVQCFDTGLRQSVCVGLAFVSVSYTHLTLPTTVRV